MPEVGPLGAGTAVTLRARIGALLGGRLLRASAWLSAGTIAGGILGYVFQVLMGRMLSTAEYGLFSAIMALVAVLSAPLSTLMMVISRKVSYYHAHDDSGSITHFFFSVTARAALVGVGVLLAFLALASSIKDYLKAPTLLPVFLLGGILFSSLLASVNDAFLQGTQRFAWLSSTSTLRILLRMILAVGLVGIGFGVPGALWGTVLAGVVGWLVTLGGLKSPLAAGRGKAYATRHLTWKPVIPVLVANIAFVCMTQLDMVLVNHFFPAREAGLYAAASALGKAVMYLPSGVALALFPIVAENHARRRGSSALLLQSLMLTGSLCMLGALAYYLLGEWLIRLLYGGDYQGAGEVLRYFGFAILPMALVMVAEYFLIAKGRVLFAYLFALVAPLELVAIYFFHTSLLQVVAVVGASGSLLAAAGCAVLIVMARRASQ
jgi:O-antigen/teichoic acid export membrane protein